jgi:hypothetical protein
VRNGAPTDLGRYEVTHSDRDRGAFKTPSLRNIAETAAVLETDDKKMVEHIRVAKGAIDARLHELQLDHGGTPEERQAITDALGGLQVLRRELERRYHDLP